MDRNSIIALPNDSLRKKSKRVTKVDEEIKKIIQDMKNATLDWEDHRPHELGVALSAVQVDTLYKIVIIRNNFEDKKDRSFYTLINPEIIKTEGKTEYDYEGCLSVKDIYGLVPRPSKVRIKALDEEGKEIRLKAQGFMSRILQHEIDHVNGTLFIDHIKDDKNAFFKLNNKGELKKIDHEQIKQSNILWQ